MMSGETVKNTNSTPVDTDYPQALKDAEDKPFKDDTWIHPTHWKQHQESADALIEMRDSLRGSIAEMETLKQKVLDGER